MDTHVAILRTMLHIGTYWGAGYGTTGGVRRWFLSRELISSSINIALPGLEAFFRESWLHPPRPDLHPRKKEKKNLQPLRNLSPHSLRLGRLPRDYRAGDEPNRG